VSHGVPIRSQMPQSRGRDVPLIGVTRSCEERESDRCAASRVVKKQAIEVLARPVSSDEGEMLRGATLSPLSPPCVASSLP
jgi:hypothetical protein